MHVFLNFTPRDSPYGGANSFLRTLVRALERHGVTFTSDPDERVDVALVNALTNGFDLAQVERLANRGVPIVHRKTGSRGRGIAELRREVDGVIVGDQVQIDFSPYLAHSIFQSNYSRDVFVRSGFDGPSTVIWNGVDEAVFNTTRVARWGRPARPREPSSPGKSLRVVISTWSTDESKGFPLYREIDSEIAGRRDLRLTLVGRVPKGTRFRAIRVVRARPAPRLAELLRHQHVILQLTRWESCSNALIEGLNCGLPAIYLESGANPEIAAPFGVAYHDNLRTSLERLLPRYDDIVSALPANPCRIGLVGLRYLAVLEALANGKPVPVDA